MDKDGAIEGSVLLDQRIGGRRTWVMAVLVALTAIIFTFIIFYAMLEYVAEKDYLELGNEQVISLKFIAGKRAVNKYELKNEGGKTEYSITYKQNTVSKRDVALYADELIANGYAIVHNSMDLNYEEGSLTVGKDLDDGEHVMLVMISKYNGTVSVQYRWLIGSLGVEYSKNKKSK